MNTSVSDATESCATRTATVLLVDDDTEWLDRLSYEVGRKYPVLTASNANDALRLASSARPDVIVLDVMMPGGKDGFQVFCDLKREPGTRHIPVVFLTQVNTLSDLDFGSEVVNRYLGDAPAAFLEKPLAASSVLARIDRLLARPLINEVMR